MDRCVRERWKRLQKVRDKQSDVSNRYTSNDDSIWNHKNKTKTEKYPNKNAVKTNYIAVTPFPS